MRYFFLLLFLTAQLTVWAQQNFQQAYANGKELYKKGKYTEAMRELQPVTQASKGNALAPYASYFYALSAYQAGQLSTADAMLMQISVKFPSWDKLDDVNLWRARIHFDNREYFSAIDRLAEIKNLQMLTQINQMKSHYLLAEQNEETLKRLFDKYSYDKTIAEALAARLAANQDGAQSNDREMLDFLVNEFELNPSLLASKIVNAFPSVKKTSYRVAVMLPFMTTENIGPNSVKKGSQFVYDIYQGIKMGVEQLQKQGITIELYAYDTQRDARRTKAILALEELKGMDLIIGPLFPEPTKLVLDFCLQNKINMVNPLSNNYQITQGNPYAYLIKPSSEMMARSAAEYAKAHFTNKVAMVFYGTSPRDTTIAKEYIRLLEADSFKIVIKRPVTATSSREIMNILTYSEFRKELNDNGDTIKVRAIQDRKVRVDAMDILVIPKDSIGHIFVAASEQLIASNTISGIDTRADNIPLITLEDWLTYETMSFEQLERLNVRFVASQYIDYSNTELTDFKDWYIRRTASLPTANSILAYDMTLFLGQMLHKHGRYFQTGFGIEGDFKGTFTSGYQYKDYQCNSKAPIVGFKNSELVIIK